MPLADLLPRMWNRLDARARALDQRMLDRQLKAYDLGEIETRRYRDMVQRWGGLRGWLLVLLGALGIVFAGLVLARFTGWPAPLAILLVLAPLWLGLGAWISWLLPTLALRRKSSGWKAIAVAVGVTVLGGLFGWWVGRSVALLDGRPRSVGWLQALERDLPVLAAAALGIGLLGHLLLRGPARLRARLDHEEAQRLRQENQAQRQQLELAQVREREQQLQIALAQSRLQLLRAQVEPHFIFNTLGAAQQLAEQRSADAAPLIAGLISFLRAAMPQMRRSHSTLGEERQLVEAYLGIMQLRIGPRLRWRIEADPGLEPCRLPPALLLTLVENAIKHGIEPSCNPAEIVVSLRARDGRLRLKVADTGVGLGATGPGSSGVGLANLRAQLALLHGDAASLTLEENEPQGFVATVDLPAVQDGPELPTHP